MEGDLIDLTPVLVLLVNSDDFSEIPFGEGERVELDTDLDDVVHTVVDASLDDRVLDFSSSQEDISRSRRFDRVGGVGTVSVVPVLLANDNIGSNGAVDVNITFRGGASARGGTITIQADLVAVAREGEMLGNGLVDNSEVGLDNNAVFVGETNLVSVGGTQSEVELFNAEDLVKDVRAAGDIASIVSSVSNSVGTKVKVIEERNAGSDFAFRAFGEAAIESQDGDNVCEVTKDGTVKVISVGDKSSFFNVDLVVDFKGGSDGLSSRVLENNRELVEDTVTNDLAESLGDLRNSEISNSQSLGIDSDLNNFFSTSL